VQTVPSVDVYGNPVVSTATFAAGVTTANFTIAAIMPAFTTAAPYIVIQYEMQGGATTAFDIPSVAGMDTCGIDIFQLAG
jgi:hypothetical protein